MFCSRLLDAPILLTVRRQQDKFKDQVFYHTGKRYHPFMSTGATEKAKSLQYTAIR